jgi:hypothetical protein
MEKGGRESGPHRGLSLGVYACSSTVALRIRRSHTSRNAQKFPAAQIATELERGFVGNFRKAHRLRLSLRVRTKRGRREAIDANQVGIRPE